MLVDTDVLSFLMNGGRYAGLYREHVAGKFVATAFVTVGELYFGAKRRGWGGRRMEALNLFLKTVAIIPYDRDVCLTYAEIKAACEDKGKIIGANDLWIAACAVYHELPLVSNNFRHFDGIPGLTLRSEWRAMREIQRDAGGASDI